MSLRKINNKLLSRVNPYSEKDFTLVLGSSTKGEEKDVIAILHPTILISKVKLTILFRQFDDFGVMEIKDHIGPISITTAGVWNTPANFNRYLSEISKYKGKVEDFLK